MEDFFAMGGYAGFIWPAYGITVIVLVALLVATLRGLKTRRRQLETLQAARGRRPRRNARAHEDSAKKDTVRKDSAKTAAPAEAATGPRPASAPLSSSPHPAPVEQGRDS